MLLIYLRVEVVLDDPSRIVPHYIDKWAMFLPSDLSLDCINVQFSFLHMMLWVHLHVLFLCVCVRVCMHACMCVDCAFSLRFASIYKYDWNLFKRRFLGPDGVSWL